MRVQLRAHERDRPLAVGVEVRERAPLWLVARRRVDAATKLLESVARPPPELVVSNGDEEVDLRAEPHELSDGNRSAARRLLPRVRGGDDLALGGHLLDLCETDPLDMTDDRRSHSSDLGCVREDDGSSERSTVRIFL